MVLLSSERFPLKALRSTTSGPATGRCLSPSWLHLAAKSESAESKTFYEHPAEWRRPFTPSHNPSVRVRVCTFVCLRVCESG